MFLLTLSQLLTWASLSLLQLTSGFASISLWKRLKNPLRDVSRISLRLKNYHWSNQSYLGSIYTYFSFKIPISMCDKVNFILANFQWKVGEHKPIHWLSWEKNQRLQEWRRLGSRDMRLLNQVLHSNKCWHLLNNPSLRTSKILYYQDIAPK